MMSTIGIAANHNPAAAFGAEISIRKLSPFVGAQIGGINLSRPLAVHEKQAIDEALGVHGVVFFRDQDLTPQQHIQLAAQFGPININRFFKSVDGHPEIAEVRKEAHQKSNFGGKWHTDHSYDEAPAKGSILYAIDVPEVGGDTLFASTYAAYEHLSDGLKETLQNVRAVHSSRHVFGVESRTHQGLNDLKGRVSNPELATQDAVHPVVITHPDTGRKALYVNPDFTLRFEGWTHEESQSLLSYLYSHMQRQEFAVRFRWTKGSVAFWDNRSTWHLALNDYQGERRLMHRITIDGVRLS
jgi:taurine dioxygenase